MDKENEWLIILNARKKDDENQQANVSENLEKQIETFLKGKLGNCEFVEKSYDGEQYTVRFKILSNIRPDRKRIALKPISIGNSVWEVDVREISEMREVNIFVHLNDLYNHYGEKENPFDHLSLKLVNEAIKCYTEQLYNAVVILCRSVIDSSICLACVWTRSKSDKETYKPRVPKPFDIGDEVSWKRLKEKSIELGYLQKATLDEIEKVRDWGNFAAHIAERQLKEMREWSKENHELIKTILEKGKKGLNIPPENYPKGYKLYTSKTEAYHAIEMTVDFLKKLSDEYNQSN